MITNAQIIMTESVKLMEQGILKPTGRTLIMELPDGTKKELPEPEPIHTFNGWKERGFVVRKGEKSKIKFVIWKHISRKATNEETGEEEEIDGHCVHKLAFFFTADQVERIA